MLWISMNSADSTYQEDTENGKIKQNPERRDDDYF